MYFVGRIEDRIKKEKITDTGASMMEKKKLFSISKFIKERPVLTVRMHQCETEMQFLGKKLKEIEDVNDLGTVDPRELCLVPDLVILPNFKMPTFEKYDETKCLENHLATYCHKMARHVHNEDLLIHVLYNSLIGAAAQWYTKLRKDQIHTWRDLDQAFLGRYKYMLEQPRIG